MQAMGIEFSIRQISLRCALLIALVCSAGFCSYGDVGVILNDSLDTSVARITGSGHSAVYLSRVCPESPVKLRLCRPGEQGSVISNYTNLGEDQSFEWNVVPFSVYVYGVEDPRNRPLFGTDKIKAALEEQYRDKYLAAYCYSDSCKTSDKAEWREMVGASLSRSFYIFIAETTVQQDLDFIARFNSLPNQNHFNGVTHNCADFTKAIVDSYFPHAAHRDLLNDFGMTSPKAVARSFTRYALQHPEMRFRVLHFSQLPGTIKRSSTPRSGTEQLFQSKKLLVPALFFPGYELPVFAAASYEITGRFDPEREFEDYPTVEATQISHDIHLAEELHDKPAAAQLKADRKEDLARILGSPEEWKSYREDFDSLVAEAVRDQVIPDRKYLDRLLKQFNKTGKPFVNDRGALWMKVAENGGASDVGLSPNTLFAPGSNPRLAYQLALAEIEWTLKTNARHRETMPEFKQDWARLKKARAQAQDFAARSADLAEAGND